MADEKDGKPTAPGIETGKILLCRKIEPGELLKYLIEQGIEQVVQQVNPLFDTEVSSALIISRAPEQFFEFPLSTILTPHQVGVEAEKKANLAEIPFHRSEQKHQVLDSIIATVKKISPRSTLAEDVRLVCDELFSNALYNAPFVAAGKTVERTEKISIDPAKSGRFLVGADSERVAIVCEDQFGSLDLDALVHRIKRCLELGKGEKTINFDVVGGAGIGTFMIFETCVSLYAAVDQSKKTIFACLFPIHSAYRNQVHEAKNVHFFKKAG